MIGLTWPLATYIKEAGLPYFFHGHNGCCNACSPASVEPLFYWQGPTATRITKCWSAPLDYGGYGVDSVGDASEAHIPIPSIDWA